LHIASLLPEDGTIQQSHITADSANLLRGKIAFARILDGGGAGFKMKLEYLSF